MALSEPSTIKSSHISVAIEPIVIFLSSELSSVSAIKSKSASIGLALLGMSFGKMRLGIGKMVTTKLWSKY